jgi:hypothetical protein
MTDGSSPGQDLLADIQSSKSRVRYRNDPVRFFVEVLGVVPWGRQREFVDAVARYPKVCVRSGHKVSKSNSLTGLALWWLWTREGARIIMTSASYRQVRSILWRELRIFYANSKVPFGGVLHLDPDSGLQLEDGREVLGFSTDEPERMQGLSGVNMLFILDEASGIPEPIFEAVEGNLAGGGKIVMCSNPTSTSGTFYEAFHEKRDLWHPIHISSEESPNVKAGEVVIPGLATKEWVEERKQEWGEDSPLYQVRVRGNFPSQARNAIVTVAMVEAAVLAWEETKAEGRLTVGVDVARFGDDDTVIQPVRGAKALAPVVMRSMDGPQVAGKVLEVCRGLVSPGETALVRVDTIGVGASVYDFLKYSKAKEVEVEAVNASTKATVEEYELMRDQLWFGVAQWLKEGGTIPSDPRLEGELVAPTYSFNQRGKIKAEPKEEVKKRIRRSPDRADALALAVGFVIQPKRTSTGVTFLDSLTPDRDAAMGAFENMVRNRQSLS